MPTASGFRHEALFYRGTDELVAHAVPFLVEGVEQGAAILVLVPRARHDVLRISLGDAADAVTFADVDEVGRDPSDLVPVWRWFVDTHGASGRPMRGIGEPLAPRRSRAQVDTCHRNEAQFNVAFADVASLDLLCPYDLDALDPADVERARRTHPIVSPPV